MIRKCTSAGDGRGKKLQPRLIKIQGGLVRTFCVAYSRLQKPRLSLQSLRAYESKQCVFHREGLHQVQEGRLGKTRDISRPPPRRSTLLSKRQMDFDRDCERSRKVGDYLWTVLTQAKRCLPTVMNAFIQGSLQDL